MTDDPFAIIRRQKEEFEKDKIRYIIDTEKTKNYALHNILLTSLSSSLTSFDGFPLVLVFFDIVNKVINLLKPRKYDIKNRK